MVDNTRILGPASFAGKSWSPSPSCPKRACIVAVTITQTPPNFPILPLPTIKNDLRVILLHQLHFSLFPFPTKKKTTHIPSSSPISITKFPYTFILPSFSLSLPLSLSLSLSYLFSLARKVWPNSESPLNFRFDFLLRFTLRSFSLEISSNLAEIWPRRSISDPRLFSLLHFSRFSIRFTHCSIPFC